MLDDLPLNSNVPPKMSKCEMTRVLSYAPRLCIYRPTSAFYCKRNLSEYLNHTSFKCNVYPLKCFPVGHKFKTVLGNSDMHFKS